MKKRMIRILATAMGLTVSVGMVAGVLAGCKRKNGSTPLVFSTDPLDGVFNPFFYTAGADGDVVGQTMIGMLSSDSNGNMVAGAEEPCVSEAFSVVTTGSRESQSNPDDYSNYYTDYYFAVKDNITFSDGTPLTIKDVLFNIYMYLDPAYTGSSTMYSVDIQGLAAYRTQTENENDQGQFDTMLEGMAQDRIDAILDWADDDTSTWASASDRVKSDLSKVDDLFKEELATDWNNAMAADLKDYAKYVDSNGTQYFTENYQIFLFNYGVITATLRKNASGAKYYDFDNSCPANVEKTQDALTSYVFSYMLGGRESASDSYKQNVSSVIQEYATANTFRSYLVSDSLRAMFEGKDLVTHTVSGITTYKADNIPSADGGTIPLGKSLDILKIRINGEDPKAIQNFAFTVAPLHYYSSHANEFSLTAGSEYFGVEFGDPNFMDSVRYIQVPLGAGPYRASTENGSQPTDKIEKSDFYKDNIVYFESNESFFLGAPKIKKLRYKVISTSLLYDAVKNGEVHYASPTATNAMINNLDNADSKKLDYVTTQNLGYGYIGINAQYVHELPIRQAIMHAMNTGLCIDYYGSPTLAEPIYRPMSKTIDWCYPNDSKAYYEYDETGQTSLRLAQQAGYSPNSDGILADRNGKTLKFTFTIAGDSDDHPAYQTMQNAANVLNNVGFDITVTRDSTALSKLASGLLEVWAAAWSSSSDPDMYQVYHKDSSATSILAWGFPYIEREGSEEEKNLLEELAAKIEEGRETTDRNKRKETYAGEGGALDLVMELAVELPTYQRRALYVFKKGLFDDETVEMMKKATAYESPLSKIWLASYK